jgi:hypothetical protein
MKKRYTGEQIIRVLKESEAGAETKELVRRHGITATTFYRWKAKFLRSGAPATHGTAGDESRPPYGRAILQKNERAQRGVRLRQA